MIGVQQEEEDADDSAAPVKEEEQADADAGPSSAAVKDEDAAAAPESEEDDERLAGQLPSAGAQYTLSFGQTGILHMDAEWLLLNVLSQVLTSSIMSPHTLGAPMKPMHICVSMKTFSMPAAGRAHSGDVLGT